MKRLICLIVALITALSFESVLARAAGEVPVEMKIEVSKKSCSAVDSVSVRVVISNVSNGEIRNIVISPFESENLVSFTQSSNCAVIYGPSGKALESKQEAKITSLKAGYSFVYSFNVMIDPSAARGKLAESEMSSLETRAARKNVKKFTQVYSVTGAGVSGSVNLKFGELTGNLKVSAYYGLTKENYDTVTQKQKPPETTKAKQESKKNSDKKTDKKTEEKKTTSAAAAAKVAKVPFLNQLDLGYPNGCEATSAAMVLRFYGFDVTVADVVSATPKASKFYKKNGVWYGGDPFKGFVGDPKKTAEDGAYGCFAPPIVKAMKTFAGDRVKNISGCNPEMLFDCIRKGKPVVVWGSNNDNLENGITWKIVDNKGNVTEDTFTRIVHEHCMVLIGYDENYVYLNNPIIGANYKQSKAVFIKNFKILYSQAIIIE